MTFKTAHTSAARHSLMLTLAALSLFLKVLIPPGYMAAPAKPDGPAFALVLCTAQGMVTLDPADEPPPADEDGARHSPCAFAGHGLNAPAPALELGEWVVFAPSADLAHFASSRVVPGRGLAAPPAPVHGPPAPAGLTTGHARSISAPVPGAPARLAFLHDISSRLPAAGGHLT